MILVFLKIPIHLVDIIWMSPVYTRYSGGATDMWSLKAFAI